MKQLVTPKQVARALGVSESSVKRWCDKGTIPTKYTGGGHRRIPLSGLLEFLRSSKFDLVDPEMLGLPATVGKTTRVVDRAAAELTEALLKGDEQKCRAIVLDLYVGEHRVAAICDQVFARCFKTIGDRWECGDAEVYQERRGCEISLRVLHELRMLQLPSPESPLAIGGAIEGDQYSLATTMAELVLRDARWNAFSLGDNLPFETLAAAIKKHRPRLLWLSVSHLENKSAFLAGYTELFEEFELDVAFVVGGRAIDKPLRQKMQYAAYCDNMRHLESFANTLNKGNLG